MAILENKFSNRRNELKLSNISLKGFKSINPKAQDIPIGNVTVFLGANGSGKSNLISFFQMLNFMTTGALQTYIGQSGSADSLLYFGSKQTTRISAEISFSKDINGNRFIPYIQLHEFETLILSEPTKLEIEYFDHKYSIEELKKNVSKIGNSELINDDSETSPSKRIIKLIPEYEYNKASSGATIAGIIGVNTLKAKCQHFSNCNA